jgi:mRNA interferase MazF
VALPGDHGKARFALVVQNDLSDALLTIVVLPLTPIIREDLGYYRITVDPTPENGLRLRSQIAVNKPNLAWRFEVQAPIGVVDGATMRQVDNRACSAVGA